MEKLSYSIKINAPKELVWETMLNKESYKKWIKAFSENSTFKGDWKEGAEIIFYDPNMGGTKARLDCVKPYKRIHAVHIGLVNRETQDVDNEYSKTWIGATETYILSEQNAVTTLNIEIETHKNYVDMFNSGWDKALAALKELCEQ